MSRRLAWVLSCVVVASVVGACSDPPAKPAPAVVTGSSGGGGGGGGGGSRDGGVTIDASVTDAGVCTDLTLTGSLIDREGVVGDPPISSGGTIVDGTYDLTVYAVYVGASGVGGPTGITARGSIRIAAGKIDEVIELGGTGKTATTRASRSVYSASSASFTESEICPNVGAGKQLQFTANDPLLVLTDPTSKETYTFTKR